MTRYHQGFPDEGLEELARRLEAAFAKVNSNLLKAAGLTSEEVVDAFVDVQSRLLGFDEHGRALFREAVENARVKTYTQGNIFLACVLCSAIALSEFKKQPRAASKRWSRLVQSLRDRSTSGPALGAFAWTSFYALMGTKTWRRVSHYVKNRPLTLS
jgi:predicted amino acid dehydrogenase